jgi:hypothetical protein
MCASRRDSLPGRQTWQSVRNRLRRTLTTDHDQAAPGDWEVARHRSDRTMWHLPETNQIVVCERHREGAWTAEARPAVIDGEEVDLNLTAGPASREIAEHLARQYMAHELVLAPTTAMQPRR